ncbi:MAG: nicotinate (nicotinamide) nucleotide adenylyltransferase [Victivallaceae bacterium]|nr:nicotinate (nicotinamide) nucleotide adenylyltransferase [Victivallaceae bacterium]
MRIAFFGGTFDPPHRGHLELARQLLERGVTDRLLFVPAYDPPHKPDREISPFADRLAMLKLLIAGESGMMISDIEQRAGIRPSYTVEIMRLLEAEFPGDRLQLLIGGDSLAALHTWHEAGKLLARYEILCCPRRGYEISRRTLSRYWTAKEIDILLQSILQMPFFDLSSTMIRNAITAGNMIENMDEKLLKYIKTKGLYLKETA